ncbi:hypothetical protein [Streptomyces lavendulae]|uniref:hypothetical protein n=1 Tax=Streptomyces lavendulae TaxID=1914 RepID=UPI0031ECC697
MPHRIIIEPYEGDSAYGPTYGPPAANVPALVSETVRTARGPDGRDVTSTAQVITGPEVTCPPESRITLPSGRITTALHISPHTAPGLPLPESTEVMCE